MGYLTKTNVFCSETLIADIMHQNVVVVIVFIVFIRMNNEEKECHHAGSNGNHHQNMHSTLCSMRPSSTKPVSSKQKQSKWGCTEREKESINAFLLSLTCKYINSRGTHHAESEINEKTEALSSWKRKTQRKSKENAPNHRHKSGFGLNIKMRECKASNIIICETEHRSKWQCSEQEIMEFSVSLKWVIHPNESEIKRTFNIIPTRDPWKYKPNNHRSRLHRYHCIFCVANG